MSNFNSMSASDVMANYAQNASKSGKTFNPAVYLNTRLQPGETEKKIRIRLLPISKDDLSIFKKFHAHNIKVSPDVAPSGWKSLPCPKRDGKNYGCPLCEAANSLNELANQTNNEAEKQKLLDSAKLYYARDKYVCRCIERGHEDEGVKFWFFNGSSKGDGVYDKIMSLFKERYESAKEDGEEYSIFDLNNGKDLTIKITPSSVKNQYVYTVTDSDKRSPLTENYDLGMSWIQDDKVWEDMFTYKPYDYMKILAEGGKPVWDKESNGYVDKDKLNEEKKAEEKKNFDENYTAEKMDFSVTAKTQTDVTETVNTQPSMMYSMPTPVATMPSSSPMDEVSDDLPF